MTTTTTERPAPEIPDDLHEEARELIRNLAASGGDANGVYSVLQAYCSSLSPSAAAAGLAAALLVTFTECITHPVEPGDYADVALPYDPTEGAISDEH